MAPQRLPGFLEARRRCKADDYGSGNHLDCCLHGCPCGYYGDPKRACSCAASAVSRYQKRISGPLLDRIDIHLEVPRIPHEQLADRWPGEPATMRGLLETSRHDRLRSTKLTQILTQNAANSDEPGRTAAKLSR